MKKKATRLINTVLLITVIIFVSSFTNRVSACNTPTGLATSNLTSTSVMLNWTAVSGAASYNIRYKKTSSSAWTLVTSTTNSKTLSSLTAGTGYQVKVKTKCSSTSLSSFSTIVNFTTPSVACSTPSGLSTSAITTSSATFNWTAVSGAISYNIQYRASGATNWSSTTSTSNSKTVSSLASATAYEFKVQTVCSSSSGSYSATTTFATSSLTCSVPSGLTVSSITSSSATLNWTAVSGAISYNIQYKASGATSWTSTTSTTNSKTVSSLSSSTSYQFQVQTVCSSSSAYSTTATFGTSAVACSVPSGLAVSAITSSTATLSWTAVSGAVSYNIQYRATGASNWTSTTSTANSKTVSSLTSSTGYEFQVQTVCSSSSGSYSSAATFATSASAAITIPVPDHIVICIMENHGYSQIIGSTSAPRINALANDPMSASFTQSYGVEHPSQPNYLDMFSGTNQGITNDNLPNSHFTTANLARELINAGRTFATYSEGLPSAGYDGASSGSYQRKHNPVANWMGSGTNQVPSSTNQPFTAFPTNFASLPTVSYVVPNQANDMHDGTVSAGDTWFYNNMNEYVQWAKGNNSLFILLFDEDDGAHNNQIVTIFTGAMVLGGQNTTHITHYNVLRTIEDMYGTSHAGNAASATPIHGIWTNDYRMADAGPLGWVISPNPFDDELQVTYTLQQDVPVSIYISNLLGEIVYKEENFEVQLAGAHQLKIALADEKMRNGIYLVRISIDGITYSKKVVRFNSH